VTTKAADVAEVSVEDIIKGVAASGGGDLPVMS